MSEDDSDCGKLLAWKLGVSAINAPQELDHDNRCNVADSMQQDSCSKYEQLWDAVSHKVNTLHPTGSTISVN